MRTDRVAGTGLAVFGLYVLWESRVLPLGSLRNPGPAALPVALALTLLLLGALIAALGGSSAALRSLGWSEAPHALAIIAVCAFAALGLERLGYRVTMTAVLLFLLGAVERRGALFAVVFSVGLAAASFSLFHTLLRVPLPRGPFGI
jgi:hypothetical protein